MERPRGRPRKSKSTKPTNPRDLECEKQMGEATVLFACGKNEEAMVMCLDVIRKVPNSADAYHTAGMIIQANGNPARYVRVKPIRRATSVQPIQIPHSMVVWCVEVDDTYACF